MANIDPAPSWAPIRQLETTDRNLAGPGGFLNTQPVSIAARLNLLRDNATALNNTVAGVSSRQDSADSAIAGLESQVLDAPGTLSDLDHGAPISVTGEQFPDVLSIDNSRGPVLALNESIAGLAQRDEWLKSQAEEYSSTLLSGSGAENIGLTNSFDVTKNLFQINSQRSCNFLADFCTQAQADAITSSNTSVDLSGAWAKMLAAINLGSVRSVFFPEGTYTFSTDIRILRSRVTIHGSGGGSILRATNNSRLILGEAIPVAGSPKPVKSGTKVVGTLIEKIRLQPAANHSGEVVLVDFADNTKLRDIPQMNPAQNDGSVVTHGIKLRWAQWVYMDNCEIQVNGACVYISLERTDKENEDHFSFKDCNFFGSKVPHSGTNPVGILFDREAGRNAPVWQWGCDSVHFGKFTDSNAGVMLGVAVKSNFTTDNVTVAGGTLVNCWFEAVDYPHDQRTLQVGPVADGSFFTSNGCTYMGATKVCYGGDFSKTSMSFTGAMYIQCAQIGQGVRMHWVGNNRISQPTGSGTAAISAEGISRHRLANRYTGASSLDSVRLAAAGNATIPAGATTVIVTHQLAVNGVGLTPDIVQLSPNFVGQVYPSAIGGTTFTINVAASDPAIRTVSWSAQVNEN